MIWRKRSEIPPESRVTEGGGLPEVDEETRELVNFLRGVGNNNDGSIVLDLGDGTRQLDVNNKSYIDNSHRNKV